MTKAELINALCTKAEISKSQAEKFLSALSDVVTSELVVGSDVTIPGIAKLTTTTRAARVGRNPKTGEEVQIPACGVVKFKATTALKDAVA